MTGTTRRIAAIDVGTNTIRLLAIEVSDDHVAILDDFGEVTRLGAALSGTGQISPDDADRSLACLRVCLERVRRLGIYEIDVAGTEVFRAASNGVEVAGRYSDEVNHLVRVLSEDQEAEAAYLGAVGWEESSEHEPVLVIDVGGGSTELVYGEGIIIHGARSFPLGALRVTESYLRGDPPAPGELDVTRSACRRLVGSAGRLLPLGAASPRVVGVGGTACAIGAWVGEVVPYDPARVHGLKVQRSDLDRALATWAGQTIRERMQKGEMSEGRARVVLGGGMVFEALFEALGLDSMDVSTRGLRHGLILRRLLLA